MEDPEDRYEDVFREDILRQLQELRQRVASLEQQAGFGIQEAAGDSAPAAALAGGAALVDPAKAAPVFGKALLAIAGAYLLRALTELETLPRPAGVSLGIGYALIWLVLAARAPVERRLVINLYGLTSVLVLAPLLWEATVRFHAIPAAATAAVLTGFSVFGLAVSWRKNLAPIAWITTLAGVSTTAVLLVATREVVAFTGALLVIAAAVEFSAMRDHWLSERSVAALFADLAALFLTYLTTRERGLPEGYPAIPETAALAVQMALPAIYLGSTVTRTLVRGLRITWFETLQSLAVFGIWMGWLVRVSQGNAGIALAGCLFALAAGVGCYLVSFYFLDREGARDFNFYAYSTFGILLVLGSSGILLSRAQATVFWSVAALLCTRAGARAGRKTLRFHGGVYLALAGLVSGVAGYASSQIAGPGGGSGAISAPGAAAVLGAIVCYALTWRATQSEGWADRWASLLVAGNLAWLGAGLSISGLAWLWTLAGKGGVPHGALRTAVLTTLSVAAGWAGSRWSKTELKWLVYPLMAVAAYTLLSRDLGGERTGTLFVSLLFYGSALVVLPKVSSSGRKG